jgi:Asp-tRNA(Asn)/Glu-tRNA(Gln) amidotransferase A subunit family amidase
MYLEDVFTVTANLTGMPAISVPMGTLRAKAKHASDRHPFHRAEGK